MIEILVKARFLWIFSDCESSQELWKFDKALIISKSFENFQKLLETQLQKPR